MFGLGEAQMKWKLFRVILVVIIAIVGSTIITALAGPFGLIMPRTGIAVGIAVGIYEFLIKRGE